MQASYDVSLVALSVAMAIFASFAALGLVSHVPHIPAEKRLGWLAGGAVAMGSGIWAMHFVGMLAFHLPTPLAYDLPLTALSAFIAIAGSGLGLYLARKGIGSRRQLHASALLLAAAISAAHYIGMAALRMSPSIDYHPGLVGLSFLIAYAASLFALGIALRRAAQPLLFSRRNLIGAVLLGAAIAGTHYVGMAAARFPADSLCQAAPEGLAGAPLAVAIASFTLLILATALVTLRFDFRLVEQQARLVGMLREQNRRLQARARALADSMTAQVREGAKRDRLLATIVEQSDEAIVTVDLRGVVTIWNPGAERMYGYPADEALGKPFRFLFSPEVRHDAEHLMDPSHTPSCGLHFETRFVRRNGSHLDVALSQAPLFDSSGSRVGHIHIGRDITEHKRALEEIRRLNETLEERVRERTAALERAVAELEAFSYSASHDLRAPLRALDGFSHLLREDYMDRLDEQGLYYLSRIRTASQRMGDTIDALIDLARLGRKELQRVPVSLSALAEEVRQDLSERAPERQVAWEIADGLQAHADPEAMRAVLENLLRNAWKFTAPRERAEIVFGAHAPEGEPVYFVRDNGVGFDMAYADKLFGAFQRLHHAAEFEGTGIGLATVQRLIGLHGGRAWAEGKPDAGATFYFTLGSATA